jgi:CHAT domain-containing protein
VGDQSTAELMRYFYTGILRDKMSPAAALRAAQIKLLDQGQWTSPYYWAAFILEGQWQ